MQNAQEQEAAVPFFPPIPQVPRVWSTMQRGLKEGRCARSTVAYLPHWPSGRSGFANRAVVDSRAGV